MSGRSRSRSASAFCIRASFVSRLIEPSNPRPFGDMCRRRGLLPQVRCCMTSRCGSARGGHRVWSRPSTSSSLARTARADQEAMIRVHVLAANRLAQAAVQGMVARGSGAIINVASLAGFLPGSAGHTLYAASKAWMIRFSESLALECEADGVRVCALCPGFTYSEFHDVTGTREQLAVLPAWMWMSAERVVREGLAASAAGRLVYIPGRINRAIAAVAACLPRSLVQHLSRRESRRFRDTR